MYLSRECEKPQHPQKTINKISELVKRKSILKGYETLTPLVLFPYNGNN